MPAATPGSHPTRHTCDEEVIMGGGFLSDGREREAFLARLREAVGGLQGWLIRSNNILSARAELTYPALLEELRSALAEIPPGMPPEQVEILLASLGRLRTAGPQPTEHLQFDPISTALQDLADATHALFETIPEPSMESDQSPMSSISILIDPGSAPAEEIADILSDLSVLYRRIGGSGIDFTPEGVRMLAGGGE
ncbi:hypothetical protein [Longimicrobium terrae]|uniref:Uncharacterized protein n=1 Tax=Longimicrobium terrae TaxID=1639882 RepID=A0A841GP65_9BACT|nr:hypothetical protein [Longimicrobium terrae]MBB4634410.1 hypothetical protein [Longimicrobium terrae]MBB6068700.1 hypothetical protein [Longimicrobium terrae]NNC27886.1 hypothetical protein [Longimicrobium terrae]